MKISLKQLFNKRMINRAMHPKTPRMIGKSFRLNKESWPEATTKLVRKITKIAPKGIFLTGIEGADPFVDGIRRDQFREAVNFYETYNERLQRIKDLGITWLRIGPPYSRAHINRDTYQLEWFDEMIKKCDELGITVIIDLLHFGLPDWLHENKKGEKYFQNTDFPELFAAYVEMIVRRYPQIKYFTPVNEPFVTASLSARFGHWNEQLKSDASFTKAVVNIAKAAILARQTIESVWQDENRSGEPIFFQNDSFEEGIGTDEEGQKLAKKFNVYRFAALDLIFGQKDKAVKAYLLEHGLTEKHYQWFMANGKSSNTILGIDYYPSCIHVFSGTNDPMNHDITMPYQLYRLAKLYWQRYKIPLAHCEVNAVALHATSVCQMTYDALFRLRIEGVPILGMGWYGDESQMDWQSFLTEFGNEHPVGLYRNGQIQPVAHLFSELAQQGFPPLKINAIPKIGFL